MDEHSCRTDIVHGRIRLTRIEDHLAHKPVFNRLHNVFQNSGAFLILPSVRTQRYEHSPGTTMIAGVIFFKAVQNTDPAVFDRFYKLYAEYVKKLVASKCLLRDRPGLSVAEVSGKVDRLLEGGVPFIVDSNSQENRRIPERSLLLVHRGH